MNILINCSNLKKGGGLQVADSICCDLNRFQQHQFVVVLSDCLDKVAKIADKYPNVKVLRYNSNNGIKVLLTGRDAFLDSAVSENRVDVVLSIFGPISWTPHCPHLCGFARSHIVLYNSIYFKQLSIYKQLKSKLHNAVLRFFFRRGVTAFFTENAYISEKWQRIVKKTNVYTVTNYYNQVYDHPEVWHEHVLPVFDGHTFLCITANYPHKNLKIAINVARELKKMDSTFRFRFAFTIDVNLYPELQEDLKSHFLFIGPTDIRECPSLYRQADIMFQPTLLECFTATYPEAMKMGVPIVTTDMEFSRGLCEDAAIYYSPLNPVAAAKAIYKVAVDHELRERLVSSGKKQLLKYDTYEQRSEKLIKIAEGLVKNKKR